MHRGRGWARIASAKPPPIHRSTMTDHIYKSVEITGSSTASINDAINTAVAKASSTLRNLDWFEVTSVRGAIADGAVAHYQVTMKLGFRLED
jgi:dodecin